LLPPADDEKRRAEDGRHDHPAAEEIKFDGIGNAGANQRASDAKQDVEGQGPWFWHRIAIHPSDNASELS
jgi:hypothetical protein